MKLPYIKKKTKGNKHVILFSKKSKLISYNSQVSQMRHYIKNMFNSDNINAINKLIVNSS